MSHRSITYRARKKLLGGKYFWHVERADGSVMCACGMQRADAVLIANLLNSHNARGAAALKPQA